MIMNKVILGKIGIIWNITLATIFFLIPIVMLSMGFFFGTLVLTMTGYLISIFPWILAIKYKRSDIQTKVSWTIAFIISPMAAAYLYLKGAWVPSKNWKLIRGSGPLKSAEKTEWNKISNSEIIAIEDTIKMYTNLIEDLESAKEEINIQYFIITEGIFWNRIKEIILKKHSEGVKINILADYVGNVSTCNIHYEKLISAGINFSFFGKQNLFWPSGKMNFRNHNKSVTIDNKIAYTGGANIGDEYASLHPKYGVWFDLSFRVEGELVGEIRNNFFEMFSIATNTKYVEKKSKPLDKKMNITMKQDGPNIDSPVFLNDLINSINNSSKNIKIVTPYYIIPQSLSDALAQAVQRGVKVEIITSGRADKIVVSKIGKLFIEEAVSRGVNFFKTNNTFIHSKLYIFDDEKVIIGTSNLDYRALYYNYETNFYIKDENFYKTIDNIFTVYKKNSYRITKSSRDWGFTKSLINKFLKLVSPTL